MTITDLDWWLDDTVKLVPDPEVSAWEKATSGTRYFRPDGKDVDDAGKPVPFGTGPHSWKNFELWSGMLLRPNHVLEIGFNTGNGSAALLSVLPVYCRLTSIDIRDSKEVRFASDRLNERFNGRHALVIGDSGKSDEIAPGDYDAAFIDGDHSEAGILRDIQACRRLGIRKYLFDDVFPQFGDTISAIRKSGLKMRAILGANMAVCEDV